MAAYIVLSSMRGRFLSDLGNSYDNFQMMGYVQASSAEDAVAAFFDEAPYPIAWSDVEYMWAERLSEDGAERQYGDYARVYVDSLRRRWDGSTSSP